MMMAWRKMASNESMKNRLWKIKLRKPERCRGEYECAVKGVTRRKVVPPVQEQISLLCVCLFLDNTLEVYQADILWLITVRKQGIGWHLEHEKATNQRSSTQQLNPDKTRQITVPSRTQSFKILITEFLFPVTRSFLIALHVDMCVWIWVGELLLMWLVSRLSRCWWVGELLLTWLCEHPAQVLMSWWLRGCVDDSVNRCQRVMTVLKSALILMVVLMAFRWIACVDVFTCLKCLMCGYVKVLIV